MSKAARVRKAPTVHEQAQAKRTGASPAPDKPSKVKIRLPIVKIFKPIGYLIRPLRWLMPTYFINAWREVRQVSWPNRRETWRLTAAVFIFAIVFGSMVAGVDKVLDLIFKKVILKV